tara:strand:+ start:355 stop:1992 length:1638 start_codon:yes stop_codon:yes gene_type:complete
MEKNVFHNLKVILNARVLEEDFFQLFYTQQNDEIFQIKNSVKTVVKGNNTYQDILFELPNLQNLNKLRLDIGENFRQQPVEINEIRFIKDGEEIVLDISSFNRLFVPNQHIEILPNQYTFIGKAGKAGTKSIYDPFFISNTNSKEFNLIAHNPLFKFPYIIAAFISLLIFLILVNNVDRINITQESMFITLFLLILVIPTLQNKFNIVDDLQNMEKRELTKKPSFNFSTEFFRNYEAYFNDNFGLRNYLINWGGNYRTKLFRSSMHPELVMLGKNKWLFYNRMDGRIFRSYSRTNILSSERIKQVVDKWEDNLGRYETDGRKYFLAFWPNKHSIYPEQLPYVMNLQIKDTISRIDQILQYLEKNNSSVKLLDVRPTLLEEKKNNLVYHKFDSHWNDYGAFLGYRNFFKETKDILGIEPKSKEDFEIRWDNYNQGELIQMLGVHNQGFFIEKNPTFTLKDNIDQIEYLPIDGYPKLTVITRNQYCGNKKRALIFRDSFTNNLIQFFSLHFYEVYYIWGHHEEYVDKLQPDIIIDGFVEREIGEKIQ